jgi:hypothetical protein
LIIGYLTNVFTPAFREAVLEKIKMAVVLALSYIFITRNAVAKVSKLAEVGHENVQIVC